MICEPIHTYQDPSLISSASFVSIPWSRSLFFYDELKCNFLRFGGGGGISFPLSVQEASGAPFLQRGEAWAELRRLIRMGKAGSMGNGELVEGRTLYKRKGRKVRPADVGYGNGEKPRGDDEWRKRRKEKEIYEEGGRFRGHIIPKFSKIARGDRLRPNRIKMMKIGTNLWPNERELLMEVLYNREAAIAFDSSEKGRIHDDVEPPHVIPTIPHKPWQSPSFRIPAALHGVSAAIIQDRLACGTIERSFGPYRNPWFLVEKPGYERDDEGNLVLSTEGIPIKRYRLINSAQRINAVSIRDASLPPGADEFSERFAGYPLISLIDLFSGYDQCTLAPESRDITSFHTPLGLMRMTTLPQGYTNAVQAFDRVIKKVLHAQIVRGRCEQFIDDVVVRPKSRSRFINEATGEPTLSEIPGVRRFVLEAIQNLDAVLADIERAGATISGHKSVLIAEGIKVVAYVCDSNGRHPDTEKVKKILDWPPCKSVTEAKAFIGLCVYYRIWIKDFTHIADPIFATFRKREKKTRRRNGGQKRSKDENRKGKETDGKVDYIWGTEQQRAMDKLKEALVSPPALRPIVYTAELGKEQGKIVLGVDARLLGFGAILQQEDEKGQRHPARYESGLWTETERNYDAGKLECRALLRAVKKFRNYLYGVHFLVEIDARTLVYQLNQPINDIPGAVVGRWLAYIRLFSFDIVHIPGTRHKGPDSLSRRPPTSEEEKDLKENGRKEEDEIEEAIEAALGRLRMEDASGRVGQGDGVQREGNEWLAKVMVIHEGEGRRDGELENIVRWLLKLEKPTRLGDKEFARFKREATKYLIRDGVLYRRGSGGHRGCPPRKVISDAYERGRILQSLHDESGHRGRDATYNKVKNRFYWKGLYSDVNKFIQTCERCQKRRPNRYDEPLHPTFSYSLWMKIGLDVVHMPVATNGCKYLAGIRDDLSGWAEYKAIRKADSKAIAKFVYASWICRYGCPSLIIYDGGPENQGMAKQLFQRYQVKNIQIVPYHPQSNGLIERGHQNIIDALAKLTSNTSVGHWVEHLPAVMWADRITVRRSTGRTPYSVAFGQECLLPVDLVEETWALMDWRAIETSENPRAELLALRTRQLERRKEDLQEAANMQKRNREANKAYFDNHQRHRPQSLAIHLGDLVLLHDTRLDQSHSHKLHDRWNGPYCVMDISKQNERGTYKLAELDGVALDGYFSGDRLKKFMARTENQKA